MADYFTNFSFMLPLSGDVQKEYALKISNLASSNRFGEAPLSADFPASLLDVLEDWQFEAEDCQEGIWLRSDSGGSDAACAFVQHLLIKFDTALFVTFEWSHDCTKPRTDAYGGGAAVIAKTEIET